MPFTTLSAVALLVIIVLVWIGIDQYRLHRGHLTVSLAIHILQHGEELKTPRLLAALNFLSSYLLDYLERNGAVPGQLPPVLASLDAWSNTCLLLEAHPLVAYGRAQSPRLLLSAWALALGDLSAGERHFALLVSSQEPDALRLRACFDRAWLRNHQAAQA